MTFGTPCIIQSWSIIVGYILWIKYFKFVRLDGTKNQSKIYFDFFLARNSFLRFAWQVGLSTFENVKLVIKFLFCPRLGVFLPLECVCFLFCTLIFSSLFLKLPIALWMAREKRDWSFWFTRTVRLETLVSFWRMQTIWEICFVLFYHLLCLKGINFGHIEKKFSNATLNNFKIWIRGEYPKRKIGFENL